MGAVARRDRRGRSAAESAASPCELASVPDRDPFSPASPERAAGRLGAEPGPPSTPLIAKIRSFFRILVVPVMPIPDARLWSSANRITDKLRRFGVVSAAALSSVVSVTKDPLRVSGSRGNRVKWIWTPATDGGA